MGRGIDGPLWKSLEKETKAIGNRLKWGRVGMEVKSVSGSGGGVRAGIP